MANTKQTRKRSVRPPRPIRITRRCARSSARPSRPSARQSKPVIQRRPLKSSRHRRKPSTSLPTRKSFTRTRPLAIRAASLQPSRVCKRPQRSKFASPASPLRRAASCFRCVMKARLGGLFCRLRSAALALRRPFEATKEAGTKKPADAGFTVLADLYWPIYVGRFRVMRLHQLTRLSMGDKRRCNDDPLRTSFLAECRDAAATRSPR